MGSPVPSPVWRKRGHYSLEACISCPLHLPRFDLGGCAVLWESMQWGRSASPYSLPRLRKPTHICPLNSLNPDSWLSASGFGSCFCCLPWGKIFIGSCWPVIAQFLTQLWALLTLTLDSPPYRFYLQSHPQILLGRSSPDMTKGRKDSETQGNSSESAFLKFS